MGTTSTRKRDPEERLNEVDRRHPFWAPQLVVLFAILLDLALPTKLAVGPVWLMPSLEGFLVLGLMLASPHPRLRHTPLRRRLAIGMTAFVSATNTISLVLLCHYLLEGRAQNGKALIGAGAVLWVTNVLLFGLWFWEIDRGGPIARLQEPEKPADFLFVQMTVPDLAGGYQPGLIDYLYTSFTNATAFSPTDTMPLTATAKSLMAVQALTALLTVGLVVARAVNILG